MAAKKLNSSKKQTAALFKRVLWKSILTVAVFLTFLWLSFSLFSPQDKFQRLKDQLLQNPDDLNARIALVEIYLDNHQFSEAEKELAKIPPLKAEALWQRKRAEDPQEIQKQISGWQKILNEYPDYRDGWLQLTILYLKLEENQKATDSLTRAQELDPNYQLLKVIEKKLSSS